MSAIEPLYNLLNITNFKLSREENFILEAELFTRICDELGNIFKAENIEYLRLIKFKMEKVNAMIEENFIRCVVNDIVFSKEYSLEGIAYYAEVPEDVICDIAVGRNVAPSFHLSRKIINLHRTVRPHLYREILRKVTTEIKLVT